MYRGDQILDVAREGMENFVHAQKRFLDVIAEETTKATGGKVLAGPVKKIKKTELSELAKHATESFIDAQKKLFEVAGRQVNLHVKAAGKAMEVVKPLPVVPLADLAREGVKSYVEAQKALMDVMLKPRDGHKAGKEHRGKRGTRREVAHAAHAVA